MKQFRAFFLCLFLLATSLMKAQDSTLYTTDFRFEQGLYLNYDQFIHNHPVPKSSIVSNYDKSSLDFLRQALSGKNVTYKDSSGTEVQINVAKLWGFSENNSIYIRVNNDFSRIMVLGKLCHFTAYITTYTNGGTPDGYGMRYGTPVERLQQYVLDTQTGTVLEFNLNTMEQLLKRDPAIYDEFMKLKKRKRKQLLFVYLRKYNDKYGLYFK